ncbi:MAG: FAD-dependent oxidoreductase [Spirochaetales bacterium]|jgi:hypothetical protein|nr:FAD-dependent oxidoreductase [Spirochaetales bacterium]
MTHEMKCDILIAGASLGGVAAALTAAKLGKRVILSEETKWIGGQATTQGVPLDEHPWIERYGSSASYRDFRDGVRKYYRDHYPLSSSARADRYLNPGAGWVSALGFEPRVGLAVLYQMLAPHLSNGLVHILTGWTPSKAAVTGDRFDSVTFSNSTSDDSIEITAPYIIDATELGDLLELGGVEHIIGAESQAMTGEPSALEGDADPLKQQGFTHLVAIDYLPGEDHIIARPAGYDRWKSRFEKMLGSMPAGDDPVSTRMKCLFTSGMLSAIGSLQDPKAYESSIWNFRRVLCRSNFAHGAFPSDITMLMNGNEYSHHPLVGVPESEATTNLAAARELSQSLLYYLQTGIEPGFQGKSGFPGIRPRGDVFGTLDGLAQYPYIRESRRIQAVFTSVEQHFRRDVPGNESGPVRYPDSVGVGGYRIDIHEAGKHGKSLTLEMHETAWPQQIALGSFIPVRVENLLPACKNLGATHITNGCYRLHPTEWNIGESAGALASYCLNNNLSPRAVHADNDQTRDFQRLLIKLGVELEWPGLDFARSYNSHFVHVPDWYWGEARLQ